MQEKYWDAVNLSLESEEAFKARLKEMSTLELAEFYMEFTEDAVLELADHPEMASAIQKEMDLGESGPSWEMLLEIAGEIVSMGRAFYDKVMEDPYSIVYNDVPAGIISDDVQSEYDRRGEELPIYHAIETEENAFFRKKGVTVEVPRRFERDPWRNEWEKGRLGVDLSKEEAYAVVEKFFEKVEEVGLDEVSVWYPRYAKHCELTRKKDLWLVRVDDEMPAVGDDETLIYVSGSWYLRKGYMKKFWHTREEAMSILRYFLEHKEQDPAYEWDCPIMLDMPE